VVVSLATDSAEASESVTAGARFPQYHTWQQVRIWKRLFQVFHQRPERTAYFDVDKVQRSAVQCSAVQCNSSRRHLQASDGFEDQKGRMLDALI